MLSCQQCGAPSTASSKFCSQCGWPINPADVQATAVQAASDVAEGQRLFGEGRTVEALAMASSVLLADPDNVPALALKGDCLERSGDIEGALASYEHVVTLKPDSPLDRIRVAQLRRMASAPQMFVEERRPDRRNSFLAGAAAFVLMTSAGSALYLANTKDKVVAEVPKVETPSKSVPFTSPAPVPTQSNTAKEKTDVPAGPADTGQPEGGTTQVDPRRSTTARSPFRAPSGFNLNTPTGALNDTTPYRPVDPNFVITRDDSNKTTATGSDPDPTPEKAVEDPQKSESNGRQPIIDIHPSQPPNKSEGGSQSKESDPNEGTSLIRVARQYFLAGEYDKAAKAYERAIKLGASPASANHRLAQCYVNLRRRSEALSAYKTALTAYQRMLDNGVGDKRLVESYMDECRQAIKLLQ